MIGNICRMDIRDNEKKDDLSLHNVFHRKYLYQHL